MMNTALFLAAVVLTSLNLGGPFPSVSRILWLETRSLIKETWLADVKLASANGIDAFALNVGSDDWQKDRVDDAFNAAESGTGFKMFMSFDMSLRIDLCGRKLYLWRRHTRTGWKQQFTDQLTGENAAMFVPSFFMDPTRFKSFAAMDGAFNWNGGWPTQISASKLSETISFLNSNPSNPSAAPIPVPASLTPIANVVSPLAAPSLVSKRTHDKRAASDVASKLAAALAGSINLDSDRTIASNLGTSGASGAGNVYMSSVSPWFYTHYGPDSFNKNWIFRSDDWLYNTRWDQLIQGRNGIDIVQIISWNDYGESHYIGPIEGAQPNSNAWVDGFDHQAWLEMTSYYATAFKTGQYPAITKDQVFLSARPHPAKADASNDPVGKPKDFELVAYILGPFCYFTNRSFPQTEDNLWAVVFATQPGKLTLSADPSKPQSFDIPAGVSKLQIPLIPGQGITATLTRNGATVVDMKPDFTFNPNPETYNYNAATFIGSAE
ncbi:alpha-1,3-glucanase [Ceratobasidium sp. AG-Ba]|nr:alpha-1,3-glucanase [Ceratobasidium sp. AG-Ba]